MDISSRHQSMVRRHIPTHHCSMCRDVSTHHGRCHNRNVHILVYMRYMRSHLCSVKDIAHCSSDNISCHSETITKFTVSSIFMLMLSNHNMEIIYSMLHWQCTDSLRSSRLSGQTHSLDWESTLWESTTVSGHRFKGEGVKG